MVQTASEGEQSPKDLSDLGAPGFDHASLERNVRRVDILWRHTEEDEGTK